jgi:hypothetical protein
MYFMCSSHMMVMVMIMVAVLVAITALLIVTVENKYNACINCKVDDV